MQAAFAFLLPLCHSALIPHSRSFRGEATASHGSHDAGMLAIQMGRQRLSVDIIMLIAARIAARLSSLIAFHRRRRNEMMRPQSNCRRGSLGAVGQRVLAPD